jgi:hypothetical protein
MKNSTVYFMAAIGCLVAAGCVPARKLEDVTAKKQKCEEALSDTRAENLELRTRNEELGKTVNELKADKSRLEKDTTDMALLTGS